jgi:hypothetical protein
MRSGLLTRSVALEIAPAVRDESTVQILIGRETCSDALAVTPVPAPLRRAVESWSTTASNESAE